MATFCVINKRKSACHGCGSNWHLLLGGVGTEKSSEEGACRLQCHWYHHLSYVCYPCVIMCEACAIIAASQALGCTRWHRFFAVSATELPCCFKNLRMEVGRPSAAGDKLQQQQHEPRAAVSLAVSPSLPPPPLPSSRWGLLRSLRDAVAAGAVPPNVLDIARLCCLLCISGLWC